MLTANLWVDMGLVNGAMGTVVAICYSNGGIPPHLPVAVMVSFDSYQGPTLPDSTVPITPLRRTWSVSGASCSRLQLPLKLAWAVTIHKAQGLTLDRVVINVGKKEFSTGLTFVACCRVCHMEDLLFDPPFPFQRVANLSKSQRLQERLLEDARLLLLERNTLPMRSPTPILPTMDSPTPSPPVMDSPLMDNPVMNSPTPSPPVMDSPTSSLPLMDSPIPSPPVMHSATPSPPVMDPPTPSYPVMDSSTPSPPIMDSPLMDCPLIDSPIPSPLVMDPSTSSPPIMDSLT